LKENLQALLTEAIDKLQRDEQWPLTERPAVQVTRTKDPSHGDYACNIAMQLAKHLGRKPREIAAALVAALPADATVERTEIAGPGFINFFLRADAHTHVVRQIWEQGEQFGRSNRGAGQRVQVEFVSANPTGPLHVGHGRGAAYGACVADLLEAIGYTVAREYYVNDAGRQMDILAVSVWLRYLEAAGRAIVFPSNGYRGEYVQAIGRALLKIDGEAYVCPDEALWRALPADAPAGDKEVYIDALIERAKALLGQAHYQRIARWGLDAILNDIRDDLAGFGVTFDYWYAESSLTAKDAIGEVVERLQASRHIYEQDGALWFRASDYGDEKDRVVRRENGQYTYFAADIAYHADKFERGFDRLIDIWGADHHGYVPRVRAAMQALGVPTERLEVLLVQFANLYRGGEKVPMSTRSGSFVTLRQLREEVGRDAARFFYVMRKCEQHLDFDLDLAKSQSSDNPVYYIQYAHARICSVGRQLEQKGLARDVARGFAHLQRLTEAHEQDLAADLARYPEVVERAALAAEPHQLVHYLRELANDLHTYYNAHAFLVAEAELRDARLNLIEATRQVLANGLQLLGVSAPQEM